MKNQYTISPAFRSSFAAVVLARLLLGTLLLGTAAAPAWAQAWQSLLAASSTDGLSEVKAIAADASGNVYLTGSFRGTTTFGDVALTAKGTDYDIFVAKYSPVSNRFVWAVRAGTNGYDMGTAIAVSGENVYVTSQFFTYVGTADFGSTTLEVRRVGEVGISKLSASTGSFSWTKQAGVANDGSNAVPNALVVRGSDLYVTGTYTGSFNVFKWGRTELPPISSNNSGTTGFLGKLTDEGATASFGWAQTVIAAAGLSPTALVSSGDNLYLAGNFNNEFKPGTLPALRTKPNTVDVFVAKLTDTGTGAAYVWVRQAGNDRATFAQALAVNGANVYVAGGFRGQTATFGSTVLTNVIDTRDKEDVFVAKLTDGGTTAAWTWAKGGGGQGFDVANAVAVNGSSVYVSGYYQTSAATFGTTTLAPFRPEPLFQDRDIFMVRLTDAGSSADYAWVQRAGGQKPDQVNALLVSGGKLYLAGTTAAPAQFGSLGLAVSGRPAASGPLAPAANTSPIAFLGSLTDATATSSVAARAGYGLYPNPARGVATLRRPAGAAPTALHLTDALGRTVRHYPAPAAGTPEMALDLRDLPAGLYGLRGAAFSLRLQVE